MRHSSVAGTRLAGGIKRLLREVQTSRSFRNLDVHTKELPPFHEIVGWDGYDWLRVYALLDGTGAALMDPDLLHRGFRYSGQALAVRMQKERTRIKAHVWRLFDMLVPMARRQTRTFSMIDAAASNRVLRPSGAGRPPLNT